ncbi:MAG TPA: glycosyltransferase [Steroidobacteraceae bacterium]|nr:glycosyltransferase [Steroidobacteraceae bacterium]
MRILWIKTELLHPLDKGGRIRSYQMLRSLSRQHHVTYLCLDDGLAVPDARERAREYAQEVVMVAFRLPAKMTLGFFAALLRNLLSPLPYAIACYRWPKLREQVSRLAAGVDLIVCDFLSPSINVPDGLPAPMVLFEHNVEAMIWQRHATVPQHPLRRAYMRLQWRRMLRHEARECRRFSHVVAVSAIDAEIIRREYGVTSVGQVATGVDLAYFHAPPPRPRDTHQLVFVGSMDWMPNDDGIRWFASEVFGGIQERIPAARLTVVGRLPSRDMRALAARNPAIEVTGTVPDVRPYLERAAVAVVPLRIGGGTRLKIYEMMAMGVPVVSTAIGAEGLPIRHGEHLLIADTAAEQVSAISALLMDPAGAERLALNALRYVQQHCSWDAVAECFLAQCPRRSVTGQPSCAGEAGQAA